MRDNILLIGLEGHPPSHHAKEDALFWFEHHPMVNLQTHIITSSYEMASAKKKYKFHDLPCLLCKDGKKRFKFYGQGITDEINRLREKWAHVKKT